MSLLPLKSFCPKECICGCKEVRTWTHQKCKKQSYINNKGDISCSEGCDSYFIQHANFKCRKDQTFKSFNTQSSLLMAISCAFQLNADEDIISFQIKLIGNIMKRWDHFNKDYNQNCNNISYFDDEKSNDGNGVNHGNLSSNPIFYITNYNLNNVVIQNQIKLFNTKTNITLGTQQQYNIQQQQHPLQQDNNKQKQLRQYTPETLHIIKTIIIIIDKKIQDVQGMFNFIYSFSQPLKQQIILELELLKQKFNQQGKIQLILSRIQMCMHNNEQLNLKESDFQIYYLQEEEILNQAISKGYYQEDEQEQQKQEQQEKNSLSKESIQMISIVIKISKHYHNKDYIKELQQLIQNIKAKQDIQQLDKYVKDIQSILNDLTSKKKASIIVQNIKSYLYYNQSPLLAEWLHMFDKNDIERIENFILGST